MKNYLTSTTRRLLIPELPWLTEYLDNLYSQYKITNIFLTSGSGSFSGAQRYRSRRSPLSRRSARCLRRQIQNNWVDFQLSTKGI
jgi:hypothetical protein